MLIRDEHNIVVQHNLDYPDQADGGDSASRTGLLALSGSIIDRHLLSAFITADNGICRHPHQANWRSSALTSRDQVLNWASGYAEYEPTEHEANVIYKYASSWRVNKDVLLPHHKLSLHLLARRSPGLLLYTFGTLLMYLHIIYNSVITPESEQNQTLSLLSPLPASFSKLFLYLHPNLRHNLNMYWAGKPWRDQAEIGEGLWNWIIKKAYRL